MLIAAESVQVLKMQLRHMYVKALVDVTEILSKFATIFREGKVWLLDVRPKTTFEKSLKN